MSRQFTFRLIPEWDPQQAVLINWPQQSVDAIYVEMVKAISLTQSVMIVCYDISQRTRIQQALIEASVNLPRVRFYIIPANPMQTRNHSPFTLRSSEHTKILNFRNHRWAEKYTELYNRSFFPQAESHLIDLVLEGGSVETDGLGTLLTTSRELLDKNYELCLQQHFGAEQVLWLDEDCLEQGGLASGQVDTLARFVNQHTVCYTECPALHDRLSSFKNRMGQPYRLLPLPLPEAVYGNEGRRLPATYTQFLITNHLILMPFYQTPQDALAKNVLQSCFPTREVVGIYCRPLLENHGSIHSIALQVPV